MSTLSKRIRYLRERRDISQKDFAKKIGVSNVVMNRYESGDRKPDGEMIAKIAMVLETTADYLLGLTDDPNPPKHVQAGIPDDKYQNLSSYQREVLDFMLNSETLAFHDQPEDLLEALEDFEIYYEVWKKRKERDEK